MVKEKMLKKQWEDNDPNALMDGIDGGGNDSCVVNQSLKPHEIIIVDNSSQKINIQDSKISNLLEKLSKN